MPINPRLIRRNEWRPTIWITGLRFEFVFFPLCIASNQGVTGSLKNNFVAFTPYGPAELAWAHALLSGETIRCLIDQPGMPHHKIWVGQTANWAAQGGQVDPGWLKLMGDPGAGGMIRERQWPAAADCPVCRKMAQAAA